ncbi:hypothetical protein JMJ35_010253 [Cladonia borealis]|uniref:RING-type domain-containing protein n=1 Tax=Cladonia borealis TaxID=184061 RepID=A0AA39QSE5_9LECA|nr:hypothetical protein JMJ35_010253 [Cladonia borealis]
MKLGELANDDRSTICQERYGTKCNDGTPNGPLVSLTVKSITDSQRIKFWANENVTMPRWPFYDDYGFPKKELWKAPTTHIIYNILDAPSLLGFLQKLYLPSSNMPDQEAIASWITRPLKTGELIFVKGIRATDLPDDDNCAICHAPYGTPNEDVAPEHAVRFPCGHAVGSTCFQKWLDDASPEPRCMFCNKSVIPVQFLLEQVEEIWSIVSTVSPEAWKRGGGPACQAIRTLKRYIDEGRSLSIEAPYKVLDLHCVSLLTAAYSFGHALLQHIQLEKAVTNRHDKHLEDLGNAKVVEERGSTVRQKPEV